MKNLSEVFVRYINGQFSARLSIPITSENATPERQALYDTRNRAQRIIFAKKKKAEGYTVIEIAMQLHASKTTIEKYLKLLEEEIPLDTPTVREKQYRNSVEMKQKEIEEVRALNDKGHSIHEISCITGHIAATIYNYLDPKCSPENGHYDLRRLGKLTA